MSHGVVQEKVTNALLGALNGAREKGQLKTAAWPQLSLDAPKKAEWGDLASTVAMSLASSEQRAPHDIAVVTCSTVYRVHIRWVMELEAPA